MKEVEFTPEFQKALKTLAKRYHSIRNDLEPILEEIGKGETPGVRISGIGFVVFKLRALNSDIKKGKSGGYRIIYCTMKAKANLLTLY